MRSRRRSKVSTVSSARYRSVCRSFANSVTIASYHAPSSSQSTRTYRPTLSGPGGSAGGSGSGRTGSGSIPSGTSAGRSRGGRSIQRTRLRCGRASRALASAIASASASSASSRAGGARRPRRSSWRSVSPRLRSISSYDASSRAGAPKPAAPSPPARARRAAFSSAAGGGGACRAGTPAAPGPGGRARLQARSHRAALPRVHADGAEARVFRVGRAATRVRRAARGGARGARGPSQRHSLASSPAAKYVRLSASAPTDSPCASGWHWYASSAMRRRRRHRRHLVHARLVGLEAVLAQRVEHVQARGWRETKTRFGREGVAARRGAAAIRADASSSRSTAKSSSPSPGTVASSPSLISCVEEDRSGSPLRPSLFLPLVPRALVALRLGIRVRILEVIRLVRDLTHAALKPAFPVVHLQAHGPGTVLDEPQDQLDDHHLARRVQQRALEPVRGERGKPHDRSERVAKGKHGVELPIAAKREDSLPRLRVRILQSARRTPILKLWIIARGRVPAGHRRRQPPRAPSCGDRDRSAGTRKDFRQNARGRLAVCILEKCRDPGPADSWVHRP